jgi:hypothetical protein
MSSIILLLLLLEAVALAADRPMASVGFGGGPECAADAAKEAAEEPDVCGRENCNGQMGNSVDKWN